MKSAGIYLHIPFCAVKCMYCDFYSITDRESSIPTFIKAIVQEIKDVGLMLQIGLLIPFSLGVVLQAF